VESSERLGRHRWVAERTLARLSQHRGLASRYDRREDTHAAFVSLGRLLICFKTLTRF